MGAPPDSDQAAIAGFHLAHQVAQSYLGSLWIAFDQRRGRPGKPVLLRRIELPEATPAEALQRVACAGRDAMALNNENVLPVLAVLQREETLAIAYGYAEAEPLRSLQSWAAQRSVAFPVEVSLRVVIDLLRGVKALHGALLGWPSAPPFGGLSPDSVLISRDGRTRLCDPLIASCTALLEGFGTDPAKFAYAAPEQVHAVSPLAGTSDVFSCAAMLWELLAGHRLLSGSKAVIERKLLEHALPKLSDNLRRRDVSRDLVELVERSLSADAGKRPQTPTALAAELESCGHAIASLGEVAQFVSELAAPHFEQRNAAIRSASPELQALLESAGEAAPAGGHRKGARPSASFPAIEAKPSPAPPSPTSIDVPEPLVAESAPPVPRRPAGRRIVPLPPGRSVLRAATPVPGLSAALGPPARPALLEPERKAPKPGAGSPVLPWSKLKAPTTSARSPSPATSEPPPDLDAWPEPEPLASPPSFSKAGPEPAPQPPQEPEPEQAAENLHEPEPRGAIPSPDAAGRDRLAPRGKLEPTAAAPRPASKSKSNALGRTIMGLGAHELAAALAGANDPAPGAQSPPKPLPQPLPIPAPAASALAAAPVPAAAPVLAAAAPSAAPAPEIAVPSGPPPQPLSPFGLASSPPPGAETPPLREPLPEALPPEQRISSLPPPESFPIELMFEDDEPSALDAERERVPRFAASERAPRPSGWSHAPPFASPSRGRALLAGLLATAALALAVGTALVLRSSNDGGTPAPAATSEPRAPLPAPDEPAPSPAAPASDTTAPEPAPSPSKPSSTAQPAADAPSAEAAGESLLPAGAFASTTLDDAQLLQLFEFERRSDLPSCSKRLGPSGRRIKRDARKSRAQLKAARRELVRGDNDKALQLLCSATASSTSNRDAWQTLAELLLHLGDGAQAKLAIEQALKRKPTDPVLLGIKGDALALLGDLKGSRALWARSANVKGRGAERERRLAALFGAIGDRKLRAYSYGSALAYYRRAVVLSDGGHGPSAGMSEALRSLGDARSSQAWSERVVRAFPDKARPSSSR